MNFGEAEFAVEDVDPATSDTHPVRAGCIGTPDIAHISFSTLRHRIELIYPLYRPDVSSQIGVGSHVVQRWFVRRTYHSTGRPAGGSHNDPSNPSGYVGGTLRTIDNWF